MEDTATDNGNPKKNDAETLRALKHDIKNYLSNIYLAIEQLRYDLPEATEDCTFYIDSIATSAAKIDALLNKTA